MAASGDSRNLDGEIVLALQEEVLRVEKRNVVTGRVRVHRTVESVERMVEAELAGEELEITRVPVGREVESVPDVRTEGGVTIIPVLEEILKVEKQLVLIEELHIRRRNSTETVKVPVTLRKQRAVVERDGNEADHEQAEE